MSEPSDAGSILLQAEKHERDYEWLKAIESYEGALKLIPDTTDLPRRSDIHEKIGHAFHRAATQVDSVEELDARLLRAIEEYKKARRLYRKTSEEGRRLRCDASIAYLSYWLAPEILERSELIQECWNLTKRALTAFDNALDYGRTYNNLSLAA
jgi:tetratricopeptide (TPR) repeat protein